MLGQCRASRREVRQNRTSDSTLPSSFGTADNVPAPPAVLSFVPASSIPLTSVLGISWERVGR
eukprot:3388418-Rhodomonas_salina.4